MIFSCIIEKVDINIATGLFGCIVENGIKITINRGQFSD